ncbi:MAG: hypothetical protein ABR600_10635, partial [Actinomycetota bacterium]
INTLQSSVAALSDADETFVTDGSPGQPDEAVFVSRLPFAIVYIEKRSLADGSVQDRRFDQGGFGFMLSQAGDLTGDHVRDAYAGGLSYGVFDGASLAITWSNEKPGFYVQSRFYDGGDIDGDGATDVCFWGQQSYGPMVIDAACASGKTGTELWSTQRVEPGPEGPDASGAFLAFPGMDVTGDGLPDLLSHAITDECTPTPPVTCSGRTDSFEALSSRDGTSAWPTMPSSYDYYHLTSAEVDGQPGDDVVSTEYDGSSGLVPKFRVRNGLAFTTTWQGVVPTDGRPASPLTGMGADLNGDGTGDVVVTAVGSEQRCDGSGQCRHIYHTFVAAFVGHQVAWHYEL